MTDISIQDVYNVFNEHTSKLDELWPDSEPFCPCRKVHIIELIEGMKLKLCMVAERNVNLHETAFERIAKKATGIDRPTTMAKKPVAAAPAIPEAKTAMQLAHEAAQARIKR